MLFKKMMKCIFHIFRKINFELTYMLIQEIKNYKKRMIFDKTQKIILNNN